MFDFVDVVFSVLMDRFVQSVVHLEKMLPRTLLYGHFDYVTHSPFREILLKV